LDCQNNARGNGWFPTLRGRDRRRCKVHAKAKQKTNKTVVFGRRGCSADSFKLQVFVGVAAQAFHRTLAADGAFAFRVSRLSDADTRIILRTLA
jgi:hypothetical protein